MADTVDRMAVLRLSKLELGVLLALVKLGMDAYSHGATDPTSAILDNVPQPIFDALAGKIKSAV